MKLHFICSLMVTTLLVGSVTLAEEVPLSALQAAGLAEKYIKDMKLPKDFFVRRTSLMPAKDGKPGFYRIQYAPPPTVKRVRIGEEPPPRKVKYLHVSMEGKVIEFEKTIPSSRIIIRKEETEK